MWVSVSVVVLMVLGLGTTVAAAKDQNTPDGAEDAAQRLFDHLNDRQWGPYYRALHPTQRGLVAKAAFVDCYEQLIPEGVSFDNLDVTVAAKSSMTIPGTETTAKVTEQTVKYTIRQGDAQRGATDRIDLVWVGGRWTWLMSSARLTQCTGG